jgi:hypothetical protein
MQDLASEGRVSAKTDAIRAGSDTWILAVDDPALSPLFSTPIETKPPKSARFSETKEGLKADDIGGARAPANLPNKDWLLQNPNKDWLVQDGWGKAYGPMSTLAILQSITRGDLSVDSLVKEWFSSSEALGQRPWVPPDQRPWVRFADANEAQLNMQVSDEVKTVTPEAQTKEIPWALLISLGAAAVLWGYFGFPSPTTLANWFSAKSECIKFAEDNKQNLFFLQEGSIKAVSQWLKHGSIVVELGLFKNDDQNSYLPRLCVRGAESIEIVSVLESSAWR